MSNEFHVAEEDLFDYGAGALEEAWSLAIAAHLSFCTSCRSATEQFEALGGITLENLCPSELDANSLALCLEKLDAQAPEGKEFSGSKGSILPGVLQKYVGPNLDQIQWKSVGGGVKQAIIPTKGKATARLLRIPPGVAVPEHSHNGTELTVVLAGSYADGPHLFERGDIQLLSNHSILHARDEFEDFDEPERKRRLLRVWLNFLDGRPLADRFADRFNTGPRNGIQVQEGAGYWVRGKVQS